MKIREITLDDIDLLVRLRFDFINMIGVELSDEQEAALKKQLNEYYRKHISLGDFVAFLAVGEEEVMADAFMVINERPAGGAFITGITGTLLNVITYPAYRKKGYATLLIEALIQRARELNVTAIDLNATQMGEKVYQNLGFLPIKDVAMRLKLEY